MRFALSLILLGSLAGCATTPTTVSVPVPVPCVSERPARPEPCVPADGSRVEWLRCALVEREILRGYVAELEAVLGACVETRPESGIRPPAGALLPSSLRRP
jgi:hypothetical protein